MTQENKIIVCQPNSYFSLEVRIEDETVWLNRYQIAALFDRNVKTIGTLKEELQGIPTVANFATTEIDGMNYNKI